MLQYTCGSWLCALSVRMQELTVRGTESPAKEDRSAENWSSPNLSGFPHGVTVTVVAEEGVRAIEADGMGVCHSIWKHGAVTNLIGDASAMDTEKLTLLCRTPTTTTLSVTTGVEESNGCNSEILVII